MPSPIKLKDGWLVQMLTGAFTLVVIPTVLWAINAEFRLRESESTRSDVTVIKSDVSLIKQTQARTDERLKDVKEDIAEVKRLVQEMR